MGHVRPVTSLLWRRTLRGGFPNCKYENVGIVTGGSHTHTHSHRYIYIYIYIYIPIDGHTQHH